MEAEKHPDTLFFKQKLQLPFQEKADVIFAISSLHSRFRVAYMLQEENNST